eukprot:TRINITY_DN3377_c0_g1_i3.p1 TRINITY_DN3377_c0_g1~~TRINITY_DN3377_c0_g1_i3.p1  ORF type:complete len:399 (-),score=53.69 TRINITY_DN3377_c0_g1_i3:32-1228(-)
MLQGLAAALSYQTTVLGVHAWHEARRTAMMTKATETNNKTADPTPLLSSSPTVVSGHVIHDDDNRIKAVPSPAAAATIAAQLDVGGTRIQIDGMFTYDDFEQFENFATSRLEHFNRQQQQQPPSQDDSSGASYNYVDEYLPISRTYLRHAYVESSSTTKDPLLLSPTTVVHESAVASSSPLVFDRSNMLQHSHPSSMTTTTPTTVDTDCTLLSQELYASVLHDGLPAYKRHLLWQRQVRSMFEHSCRILRYCIDSTPFTSTSPSTTCAEHPEVPPPSTWIERAVLLDSVIPARAGNSCYMDTFSSVSPTRMIDNDSSPCQQPPIAVDESHDDESEYLPPHCIVQYSSSHEMLLSAMQTTSTPQPTASPISNNTVVEVDVACSVPVSYTHLTLPTKRIV